MKCSVVCLVALIIPTTALKLVQEPTDPVTRVVNLLKKLESDLQTDDKVEEQSYKKYACWCQSQLGAYAIKIQHTLPERMREEASIIQEQNMIIGIAIRTIAESWEIIYKSGNKTVRLENSLNKQWNQLQKDNDENYVSMVALQQALKVFEKEEGGGSLLQLGTSAMNTFRAAMLSLPAEMKIPEKNIALLSEFSKSGSLYAPQSGTIIGMMKSMYMNLAQDIEHGDALYMQEAGAIENHIYNNNLNIAKGKALIAKHTRRKTEAEKEKAQAEEEYNTLSEQLKHSKKFFRKADEDCRATLYDYNNRTSLRAQELQGVQKALEILTSDEMRAHFAKHNQAGYNSESDNLNFLQLSARTSLRAQQIKAVALLASAARKTQSIRLAQLTATLRETPAEGAAGVEDIPGVATYFEGVIATVDSLINELKTEEQEDIRERDDCNREYHSNAELQKKTVWDIKREQEVNDKLVHKKEMLEDKLQVLMDEWNATDAAQLALTQARNASHLDYLAEKSADEISLQTLKNASQALAAYYEEHAELLQEPVFEVNNERAPGGGVGELGGRQGFADKNSRSNQANTILKFMEMIIEGVENELQTAYEQDQKEEQEYIDESTLNDESQDLNEEQQSIVRAAIEDTEAKITASDTKLDNLGSLDRAGGDYNEDISDEARSKLGQAIRDYNTLNYESHDKLQIRHGVENDPAHEYTGCARALAIFEKRRAKRKIESDALTQAKAVLAGDLSQA